jgi:hypothetical protein
VVRNREPKLNCLLEPEPARNYELRLRLLSISHRHRLQRFDQMFFLSMKGLKVSLCSLFSFFKRDIYYRSFSFNQSSGSVKFGPPDPDPLVFVRRSFSSQRRRQYFGLYIERQLKGIDTDPDPACPVCRAGYGK